MVIDAASTPRGLRILVTGAAGLLGRELCGVLAGRGHRVVALLHRNRTLERNDGAAIPIRPYDAAAERGTVAALDGDVTAERFGLDPAVAIALAAKLDLVVHCAAVTAFNLPQQTYDRVNVGGTAQVLAFAAQACRAVPVLHVSTAYVCGAAGGVVEEAPTAATRFNNGYEASKAAAEALTLTAHRRGHPVAIARPSIVAGSWASGTIGAFGAIFQLTRLVAEGCLGALPASPGSSLNLVPIDYVVDALTDIAERMALADGRIFHLAASDAAPLAALEALFAEFPHLGGLRFVPIEGFDVAGLSARQRWLHGQMKGLYAAYLRPSPDFVAANIQSLSGRCCPPTNGDYLRRVVRYMVETGFLPTPGEPLAQRTSG